MKKRDMLEVFGIASGIASTASMIYIFTLLAFRGPVTIYQDATIISLTELVLAIFATAALIVVLEKYVHPKGEIK